MEEVDGIIWQSLREIGCNLDAEVKLLLLPPEVIYEVISKLCNCIDKREEKIAKFLPDQSFAAKRFAAATQLVDWCKSLGFKGDLGYQTILYCNQIELRRILMWLIERIPKSDNKLSYQTGEVDEAKTFEAEIFNVIAFELSRPWTLLFLQLPKSTTNHTVELDKPSTIEKNDERKSLISFWFNH